MGNICRSPAGEGILDQQARKVGLDLHVDSAGTHDYHVGGPANATMRKIAAARGYSLTSIARQVTEADLRPGCFDLVLAMDRDNLSILRSMQGGQSSHVRLFSDFTGDDWPTDVPDPYYGGEDGFGYVIDMIEAGCPALIEHLRQGSED